MITQKKDIIVATFSNLCHYNDAYILVKGTITVPNTGPAGATVNNANKYVIFKNCSFY